MSKPTYGWNRVFSYDDGGKWYAEVFWARTGKTVDQSPMFCTTEMLDKWINKYYPGAIKVI